MLKHSTHRVIQGLVYSFLLKETVHRRISYQRCSCCNYPVSTEFFISGKGTQGLTWRALTDNTVISTKYSEYWSHSFCANLCYHLQIWEMHTYPLVSMPIHIFICLVLETNNTWWIYYQAGSQTKKWKVLWRRVKTVFDWTSFSSESCIPGKARETTEIVGPQPTECFPSLGHQKWSCTRLVHAL